MLKIQEVIKGEGHNIITFSEGRELYGMLVVLEEGELDYVEFMEFDDNDLILITEDEQPEEFKRLKDKYYEKVLDLI